jgi:DNA-binding MarR family transcriptional regulator
MAQIVVLRKAHFFSIDNAIIDVHAKTIGPLALGVYTVLARHANRKTGECWPSIGRLASLLGVARNTIKAALRTLEAAGLILIKRRRDPAGDCTSHLFTLLDAVPAAVEARLAKRRTAVTTPEGGGSAADLPQVSSCPTGGSPVDQEPDLSPLTKEENHAEGARAADETPKTPPSNPCPHPFEERSYFGDIVVCQHCWTMLDAHSLSTTMEGSETHEEGSPPDAHAA